MKRSKANQIRVQMTREERMLLLRHAGALSPPLRAQLEVTSSHASEVWLSLDEADALREYVQDILQIEGFDEHYEPTPVGTACESLIDKLFTG